jgi:hypothetical protein
MTWAPLALAILFGLIVSAGIYFTMMWPDVEPREPADDDGAGDAHAGRD